MITKKYYKLIRVSYEDLNYLTLTNTGDSSGLFSVSKTGWPNTANLEYSINGVDWVTYDLTNLPTVEVPVDGHIYLRGTNANGFNRSNNDYYTLAMTTSFAASGNPFSLRNTDPSTFSTYTSVLNSEFCGLFKDTSITDASGLTTIQIASIGEKGCIHMFNGCTYLTIAPDLSGVTSVDTNGFREMFNGCTSLTTSPDLSGVTSVGQEGFYNMFNDCTSLTSAIDLSGVTSVGASTFYGMFKNCTNLTTVTGLSGVTSIDYGTFREMFSGCTSLTTTPDLSGLTNVGNYSCNAMFRDCNSLTTAPDLSSLISVGDYGCSSMFYNCRLLSEVTAPNISAWNTDKLASWLYNAGSSATGAKTAYVPAGVTIPTGESGIPSGWTRVDY